MIRKFNRVGWVRQHGFNKYKPEQIEMLLDEYDQNNRMMITHEMSPLLSVAPNMAFTFLEVLIALEQCVQLLDTLDKTDNEIYKNAKSLVVLTRNPTEGED